MIGRLTTFGSAPEDTYPRAFCTDTWSQIILYRFDFLSKQVKHLAVSEPVTMAPERSRHVQVVLVAAVVVLANLAICIHRSSRVYLFQQSLCLQHIMATNPQNIGPQWRIEEKLCRIREVQSPLSLTEGVDAFLQLLPGKYS